MRDILTTLKREHDELRTLYQQLTALPDELEDERRDLLNRVEAVLIPHAKFEETEFYRAFEDRANHEQKLLFAVAMQEHRVVEKAVLPDIHAADFDSRQFAGSVQVLAQLTNEHAQMEEAQIFSAARQMFSSDELAEFDEQYEKWKDSGMATAIGLHAKVKTAARSVLRSPSSPG